MSRSRVTEWLQPSPFTALGVAAIVVDASGVLVVAGFASAAVPPEGAAATRVSAFGDAAVEPFGDVEFFPALVATADVVLDCSGTSDDVSLSAAIAFADIDGPATLDAVSGEGVAGVSMVSPMPVAPAVVGDAEVSFGYFGDGDFPIFPFKLPLRFTGDQSNIQDAAAIVVASGSADLDAVGAFAPAELAFTGDTGLAFKGSTPVLPFFFPVVFDDLPANVNLAAARVLFDMENESVVELVGESVVPVEGGGTHIASAVLPFSFPVALMGAA